jgi:predicted house-cleaning NTP pyrophosphatase (Maf/HAM1 superfamily)
LAEKKAEDAASRLQAGLPCYRSRYRCGQRRTAYWENRKTVSRPLPCCDSLQGGWHEVLTGVALIDRKMNYKDTQPMNVPV